MKIAICGSMSFAEKMLEVKRILENHNHTALVSGFTNAYINKSEKEKQTLVVKDKKEKDAIREFWDKIQQSDTIIVLNYEKNQIKNYIGGNTFLEIGFAHILKKKIFLLNPIPNISLYSSEIEAMKPIILNGDPDKIA